MVLTVEPGLYFIEALIEPALASDKTSGFFVPGAIDRFRGTGGVRLEDVVVVCADGVDNYTLCPRTVDEVEHVMSGYVQRRQNGRPRAWKRGVST